MYGTAARKPAANMIGNIHQVSIAPPVIATSTRFIAISMDSMEMSDIPIAILNAADTGICRDRTMVSSAMEVNIPFTIAINMMASVGQPIPVN